MNINFSVKHRDWTPRETSVITEPENIPDDVISRISVVIDDWMSKNQEAVFTEVKMSLRVMRAFDHQEKQNNH